VTCRNVLTIHLDAAFPFLQLLGISCLARTAWEGSLGGWGIPIRREELEMELGNERQGSDLGLEIQVARMCHKPDDWNVKKLRRWQDIG